MPGEQRGGPADGHALVAHLGGRGDGDVVDPGRRQAGVAPEQLPEHLDDEVVGPGLGEGVPRPPERGADPVDEHDFLRGTAHDGSYGLEYSARHSAPGRAAAAILPTSNYAGYSPVTGLGRQAPRTGRWRSHRPATAGPPRPPGWRRRPPDPRAGAATSTGGGRCRGRGGSPPAARGSPRCRRGSCGPRRAGRRPPDPGRPTSAAAAAPWRGRKRPGGPRPGAAAPR